ELLDKGRDGDRLILPAVFILAGKGIVTLVIGLTAGIADQVEDDRVVAGRMLHAVVELLVRLHQRLRLGVGGVALVFGGAAAAFGDGRGGFARGEVAAVLARLSGALASRQQQRRGQGRAAYLHPFFIRYLHHLSQLPFAFREAAAYPQFLR